LKLWISHETRLTSTKQFRTPTYPPDGGGSDRYGVKVMVFRWPKKITSKNIGHDKCGNSHQFREKVLVNSISKYCKSFAVEMWISRFHINVAGAHP